MISTFLLHFDFIQFFLIHCYFQWIVIYFNYIHTYKNICISLFFLRIQHLLFFNSTYSYTWIQKHILPLVICHDISVTLLLYFYWKLATFHSEYSWKIFLHKKKKRQIFLLFFGAMWLLILKLMLFQKQGGCKLIFAPVWLCLSWLPNEEFKKVEIKFLEPKTVPKTWKYKASSSQHRIIKNIILSLSFSSHSFWIYVFFLNSILPFLWKEGLLFWGIVVGYLLGQKELQCNKGSWRKTSFTYGWKEAKNARFKLAVSLTLSRI